VGVDPAETALIILNTLYGIVTLNATIYGRLYIEILTTILHIRNVVLCIKLLINDSSI
jgi:hypothetical protein